MAYEQSACTHTSFAHAIALFQLELVIDSIGNHRWQIILSIWCWLKVDVCLLVLRCHIKLEYSPFGRGSYAFIYSHTTHTSTHTYTHKHKHTDLYRHYYRTTQLMPVATTQEHTQLADTVLHAQTLCFVSFLKAKKLFTWPSCGHSHCEDDCIDKSRALGFWTVQTFVKP